MALRILLSLSSLSSFILDKYSRILLDGLALTEISVSKDIEYNAGNGCGFISYTFITALEELSFFRLTRFLRSPCLLILITCLFHLVGRWKNLLNRLILLVFPHCCYRSSKFLSHIACLWKNVLCTIQTNTFPILIHVFIHLRTILRSCTYWLYLK